MSDVFTNFSLVLPLPDESAQQQAINLAHIATAAQQGGKLPPDFPASLAKVIDDWCFDTEPLSDGWGLWLHSSYDGVEAVCAFIQYLLRTFQSEECVGFEWSHDCWKPLTDVFGGGAAFITAHKIKIMCTRQWLHRQTAARARDLQRSNR